MTEIEDQKLWRWDSRCVIIEDATTISVIGSRSHTNCCPEKSRTIFERPLVEVIRRFQDPKLWLKYGRVANHQTHFLKIFQPHFVQEPCGGYKFPLGLANYDVVATCNDQSINEHQILHIGHFTLSVKHQKDCPSLHRKIRLPLSHRSNVQMLPTSLRLLRINLFDVPLLEEWGLWGPGCICFQ